MQYKLSFLLLTLTLISCSTMFSLTESKTHLNELTGEKTKSVILDVRKIGLQIKMVRDEKEITKADISTHISFIKSFKVKGTLVIKADGKIYKFDLKPTTFVTEESFRLYAQITPRTINTWREIANSKEVLLQINSDGKSLSAIPSLKEIEALKDFTNN